MTYVFEMASGKDYLGDELARPSTAQAPGAPHASADRQVELRLAEVEASAPGVSAFPAGLYLDAMISKLED